MNTSTIKQCKEDLETGSERCAKVKGVLAVTLPKMFAVADIHVNIGKAAIGYLAARELDQALGGYNYNKNNEFLNLNLAI